MTNVKVDKGCDDRISQGDIFREVECIEYVSERSGILEVSKIVFPLVVVLTQDCDLMHDSPYRKDDYPGQAEKQLKTQDKKLFSVLVAPLYNRVWPSVRSFRPLRSEDLRGRIRFP